MTSPSGSRRSAVAVLLALGVLCGAATAAAAGQRARAGDVGEADGFKLDEFGNIVALSPAVRAARCALRTGPRRPGADAPHAGPCPAPRPRRTCRM